MVAAEGRAGKSVVEFRLFSCLSWFLPAWVAAEGRNPRFPAASRRITDAFAVAIQEWNGCKRFAGAARLYFQSVLAKARRCLARWGLCPGAPSEAPPAVCLGMTPVSKGEPGEVCLPRSGALCGRKNLSHLPHEVAGVGSVICCVSSRMNTDRPIHLFSIYP